MNKKAQICNVLTKLDSEGKINLYSNDTVGNYIREYAPEYNIMALSEEGVAFIASNILECSYCPNYDIETGCKIKSGPGNRCHDDLKRWMEDEK